MSRARPLAGIWFDQRRNNDRASSKHLELLADIENVHLDDLLDEGMTQGQVIWRLRVALDGDVIPPEVIERRRQRRLDAARLPGCRVCTLNDWECEGPITRHHYVPRWLMLELENYQAYAPRSMCTIPICLGRHRDLHFRGDPDKSIVAYLTETERRFAQKMLTELREQHPAIWNLCMTGDASTYEGQMARDLVEGHFSNMEGAYVGGLRFDTEAVATAR